MVRCQHATDTRITVHILHALEQGMKIIKVRNVDTDVVTILVNAYLHLAMIQPQIIGTGKMFPLL